MRLIAVRHIDAAKRRLPRTAAALACAGALAFSGVPFDGSPASRAFAEDIDTAPVADEFQQRVEQTSADYLAATEHLSSIERSIEENRAQIERLEAALPAQQARSNDAATALYKMQSDSASIVTLLLNARDFSDFMRNLEYIGSVADRNVAEINELQSMKAQLDRTEAELETQRVAAERAAADAQSALEEAQAAREEAQRIAREKAEREAAEAQAAAEEAARIAAEEAAKSEAENAGAAEAPESPKTTASPIAAPLADDVDWDADAQQFIDTWAPRIDAYLAGSPMAGQGKAYAKAAWTYGIDPRFSPAISAVESSKGAYCFKPHNAWGWGSVSWGSWEDAINGHVAGLARGYGYTVSPSAAKKYCPPTWQDWYNKVSYQMSLI